MSARAALRTRRSPRGPASWLALAALAGGCAATGGDAPAPEPRAGGSRPAECRAGDREVASPDACLADEAACYEIVSGAYCTGPRGNVCPAGSAPLAPGRPCPAGARCIRVGESLECTIG